MVESRQGQRFCQLLRQQVVLGPNRDHITAEDHKFYKQAGEAYPTGKEKDDANFYAKNGVGDVLMRIAGPMVITGFTSTSSVTSASTTTAAAP